jgi:two-component system chemotaxis response regulator CheY
MSNRKTVLVVDDIPLMRTILAKYVNSLGLKLLSQDSAPGRVEILEASNGREALDRLDHADVDLIFLDLMMPEMDGLTFLKEKQADPRISEIPVIVCSALGERETVEKAHDLGAHSYIVKPFTLKAVEEKFRDVLHAFQD